MKSSFFLQSWSCFNSTDNVNSNETLREKDRWGLHKDVVSCFEQTWKQHHTIQQLYGYLPPITRTIQVRHAGHCWWNKNKHSPMNSCLWTHQHWLTNKNLYSPTLHRHWMLSGGSAKSNSQKRQMVRESKESMLSTCHNDELAVGNQTIYISRLKKNLSSFF